MNLISLSDLDPRIAEALKSLLLRIPGTLPSNPFGDEASLPAEPSMEWRTASEQVRVLGPIQDRVIGLRPLIGAAYPLGTFFPPLAIAASLFLVDSRLIQTLLVLATVILAALCWWFILGMARRTERATLKHYFTPEMLKALRPMLTLTPMEGEYLDAVGAMLKASHSPGAASTQSLLASLNELLEAGRRLEVEQQTLKPSMKHRQVSLSLRLKLSETY